MSEAVIPEFKPDLQRLPFFGRKALEKVTLQIIWGEALSERICRLLSKNTEKMLARQTARQAEEEQTHRLFFGEFYRWMTDREGSRPSSRAVSPSLRIFGQELLHRAQTGRSLETLWGLSVYLEGLAATFFQKSFPDCAAHWPAVRGALGKIVQEEEKHVKFGRAYLKKELAVAPEAERQTLVSLGNRWEQLLEESIRETNRSVFPFFLPVRALQAEFRALVRESREAIGV